MYHLLNVRHVMPLSSAIQGMAVEIRWMQECTSAYPCESDGGPLRPDLGPWHAAGLPPLMRVTSPRAALPACWRSA